MYRIEDRRKAVELRLKGQSYSQIKEQIDVKNGTLSYWLKNYPLTNDQKQKIFAKKDIWIEKFREAMKKKRELKLKEIYDEQKNNLGKLTKRDILLLGAGLYWGEGRKEGSAASISNNDSKVINYFLYWLEKCYGVDRKDHKVRIYLHLYSDMNIEQEINYWKCILRVEKFQFGKPYVKVSKRSDIDQKGFGHGTCHIQVADVKIKERVLATIRLLSEKSVQKGSVVHR